MYQDMGTDHMAQVSGHGHGTHGTHIRIWKLNISYMYHDIKIGHMAPSSGHGNMTHGTGIRTWTQKQNT